MDEREVRRLVREIFGGPRRGELRLASGADEIIDALSNLLQAAVELFDGEKRWRHLATPGEWISSPDDPTDAARTGCFVRAHINDRWTLCLYRGGRMHPDAESMARWAARKLAVYLPVRAATEQAVPPARGGGGSGGSAELGIPVSWARKSRN